VVIRDNLLRRVYPNSALALTSGTDSSLVVASDLRSGTVDIDLAVNSDPKTVVGHVRGAWRCPPDAF